MALIIASVVHVVVICGFVAYLNAGQRTPESVPPPESDMPIHLVSPPPISSDQLQLVPVFHPRVSPISVGIAQAVPDNEAQGVTFNPWNSVVNWRSAAGLT